MKITKTYFNVSNIILIIVLLIVIVVISVCIFKNNRTSYSDTFADFDKVWQPDEPAGLGSAGPRGRPGPRASLHNLETEFNEYKTNHNHTHEQIDGVYTDLKSNLNTLSERTVKKRKKFNNLRNNFNSVKEVIDKIYFGYSPYCADKKKGHSILGNDINLVENCNINTENKIDGKPNRFKYLKNVSECLNACGRLKDNNGESLCKGFVDIKNNEIPHCRLKYNVEERDNIDNSNSFGLYTKNGHDTYIMKPCN